MGDRSKADLVDPKYDWQPLPVPDMPDWLLMDYAARVRRPRAFLVRRLISP
jgi:hypothetical protein